MCNIQKKYSVEERKYTHMLTFIDKANNKSLQIASIANIQQGMNDVLLIFEENLDVVWFEYRYLSEEDLVILSERLLHPEEYLNRVSYLQSLGLMIGRTKRTKNGFEFKLMIDTVTNIFELQYEDITGMDLLLKASALQEIAERSNILAA